MGHQPVTQRGRPVSITRDPAGEPPGRRMLLPAATMLDEVCSTHQDTTPSG
jgi:hypothetical protein